MAVPTSVNLAAGLQKAGEAFSGAKPLLDAAGTGMQAANSFQDPQTAPPPQMVPSTGGPESLTALYQSTQQGSQAQIDKESQLRKARRMGLLGRM